LGTFAWGFPAYRGADISISGVWDRAHNTPLELAAEVGIPLAALVATGWIVIFIVLMYGVGRRRGETAIPLAGLTVALIAILHSSIDFSLQTPGYTMVVFALLGLGLSQSLHDPLTGGYRRRRKSEAATHAAVDADPR
jgi:O-antigen ligase